MVNKLLSVASLATSLLLPTFSSAATVLNLSPEVAPGIQQADQGPCVIGDPSCNSNATAQIGFTTLPNTNPPNVPDVYDVDSPVYTVGALRSYLAPSDTFDIGIDINNTGKDASDFLHNLFSFTMSLVGMDEDLVLAEYDAPNGTSLPAVNNPGNGFSDYRLSGFSLAGLLDTQEVYFSVFMDDVDAGRDQFFLIAGEVAPVPLPAGGALLLSGIVGLGLLRRRKSV